MFETCLLTTTQPEHCEKSNLEISVIIGLFQVSLQSTGILRAASEASELPLFQADKQVFIGGVSMKTLQGGCCQKWTVLSVL